MGWARWLRLMVLVALMVTFYFLVPVELDPPGSLAGRTVASVLVLLCLAAGVTGQLRRAASDEDRNVDGLVGAIVAVLTVFALAFYSLDLHRSGQLSGLATRLDALYFSASTMLTIGYGDVHAVGQSARALVLVQMVFDVVFVAASAGLLSARVRRVAAARTQSPDVGVAPDAARRRVFRRRDQRPPTPGTE